MLTALEIRIKTDQRIAEMYPPPFAFRMVLTQPLKLPGGWRLVYENYPAFGLRQSGSMLIVYVSDDGVIEEPFEKSELRAEITPQLPPAQLSALIQEGKLPALNEAIAFAEAEAGQGQVVSSEPVVNTRMWARNGQVLCWRFDVFSDDKHEKVFVGYNEDGSGLEQYSNNITHTMRSAEVFPKFGRGKRYGRLDLDYEAEALKISIDLSYKGKAGAFTQGRLMTLRDELILWFCKAHTADYLDRLGYGGLDYATITLERENVSTPHISQAEEAEVDPLGTIFIGRTVSIRSPIIFQPDEPETLMMMSWLQDPSIVFHELGHAVRYLLYTQNLDEGIEEGLCDYFSAILMDDLLETEDFPHRTGGIGCFLPRRFLKGRKFLPRPFGGTTIPPRFADLVEDQKIYSLGWKWAHFLWQLRCQLHEITGDWLKADAIITVAHFRPLLPRAAGDISVGAAYQQSLWQTIALHGIDFEQAAWDALVAENPLTD